MEELAIKIIESLPRTLLVLMSAGFVGLVVWLFIFTAKRSAAIISTLVELLKKLEIAVIELKKNQESTMKIIELNQQNNIRWLERHDDELKELRAKI